MSFKVVKEDKITVDGRQRPRVCEVLCGIKNVGKVERGATPTPLPLKAIDKSSEDFRIANTNGGHLVGLAIGGPNSSENVVSMYCGFNRYSWRLKVEHEIRKFNHESMEDLSVRIKVFYSISDDRLPSKFEVQVENDAGQVRKDFGTFHHTAPVQLSPATTRRSSGKC